MVGAARHLHELPADNGTPGRHSDDAMTISSRDAARLQKIEKKKDISRPTISRGRQIPSRLEREVVREVLAYLKTRPDIVAWRQNSGMLRGSYKGKDRVIRFGGIPGMADIAGWVRWCFEHWNTEHVCAQARRVPGMLGCHSVARALYIECKREGATPSTTQQAFLDLVKDSGGIAVIASDVETVRRALEGR